MNATAQIVNIPDAKLKETLLYANSNSWTAKDLAGNYCRIDTNFDFEIQVSEAQNISWLDFSDRDFASLEGITSFSNLVELNCNNNKLTSLNLTGLSKLEKLSCGSNQLTSLDVSSLVNLKV